MSEAPGAARAGHRAPRESRPRRLALLVAVAALATTAGASLYADGDEPTVPAPAPAAASAAPATVTVTVQVPVPRTPEQIVDDAFVQVAVAEGWTDSLTASGSVTEARALCAELEADPSPETLTASLADVESRTGMPVLDAWAWGDEAVRTYCDDLVQLLP